MPSWNGVLLQRKVFQQKSPELCSSGPNLLCPDLRQFVACDAARGRGIHGCHRITPICGAMWDIAIRVQLDVRLEVVEADRRIRSQMRLQCIRLDRTIELTQVVDTAGG